MTMTEPTTIQVHRVFIKASPQAIWDAITKSEWTERYGYRGASEFELRPGGAYRAFATEEMKAHGAPDVVVDGEVIEADPPRKLVQTWHFNFTEGMIAEPPTRVTYEIEETQPGVSKLTVTHDLAGAPETATVVSGDIAQAGGGWPMVLSDLKSLLETGKALDD
jgi:uncharacterized protein YndB with AHSA1/START domain